MKVGICSLGCKVNIYESEYVINLLKKNNYEIVGFDDYADIYIINTCTVTNTSDNKSEKMIHHAKKSNPNSIVIVMGCHSQIKGDNIDADIVIGNKDKSKIIDLINEFIKNKNKIKRIYDLTNEAFEDMFIDKYEDHTRAFVKIEDGCDAFCSYCIIPYARGNVRSKQKEKVIEEITNLVINGYQEIVLTGIHTGKYGKDINYTFEQLLEDILKIPNLYRIRISSIEINEVTDNIINMMKNNSVIANHLHIPLQSGSDKILKLMNRKYDLSFYQSRVDYIRKNIPNISITTDLIVGFPDEQEKDFNDTVKFLEQINFTKIHVFPYSRRANTKADTMPNQIEQKIKKERVRKIIELSNTCEEKYYEQFINSQFDVIIERNSNGKSYGYTSNYIPTIVNKEIQANTKIKVIINRIDNKKSICEII